MKYVMPIIEIEVLASEDIVLLSGMEIKDSGELPSVSWSETT